MGAWDSFGVVAAALPFEDIPPDEKIGFLAEAHHRTAGGEAGPDAAVLPSEWCCEACRGHCTLEALRVAGGRPECPTCRALGWETVHPGPARDA